MADRSTPLIADANVHPVPCVVVVANRSAAAAVSLLIGIVSTTGPARSLGGWIERSVLDQFPPYSVIRTLSSRVAEYEIQLAVVLDASFFRSLFVLGGDFWDKLRSLFVRSANAPRATIPSTGVL